MRYTVFVALFLIVHFSNAQFKSKYTEIYWGEETREKKYSLLNSIVSIDESGYYLGKFCLSGVCFSDPAIVCYSPLPYQLFPSSLTWGSH